MNRSELAKIVSKKASMANKRLKRLENNCLTDSPAYRNWEKYGNGQKFSVKGKDFNELQKELARVDHFINAETSTIRGTKKVLTSIADNAGIQYDNKNDLMEKTSEFFELSSKVEQYLNTTNGNAGAIGYQKIWQTINDYVDTNKSLELGSLENLDDLIEEIADLIEKDYQENVFDENLDDWTTLF